MFRRNEPLYRTNGPADAEAEEYKAGETGRAYGDSMIARLIAEAEEVDHVTDSEDESEVSDALVVNEFMHKGVIYLRDDADQVYDKETEEIVAVIDEQDADGNDIIEFIGGPKEVVRAEIESETDGEGDSEPASPSESESEDELNPFGSDLKLMRFTQDGVEYMRDKKDNVYELLWVGHLVRDVQGRKRLVLDPSGDRSGLTGDGGELKGKIDESEDGGVAMVSQELDDLTSAMGQMKVGNMATPKTPRRGRKMGESKSVVELRRDIKASGYKGAIAAARKPKLLEIAERIGVSSVRK